MAYRVRRSANGLLLRKMSNRPLGRTVVSLLKVQRARVQYHQRRSGRLVRLVSIRALVIDHYSTVLANLVHRGYPSLRAQTNHDFSKRTCLLVLRPLPNHPSKIRTRAALPPALTLTLRYPRADLILQMLVAQLVCLVEMRPYAASTALPSQTLIILASVGSSQQAMMTIAP